MNYAVVKVAGKQYKVSEGDKILVDKFKGDLSYQVLLSRDGDNVLIGKPYLEKVKVSFKQGEMVKGEKIDVFKYKAKSRYRKHIGFRAQHYPLIVEKITS